MERKEFSRELFNTNDRVARDITKSFYQKTFGESLADNPDVYGADLIYNNKLVECEIKIVWKEDVFPYESIQIPERKSKIFVNDRFSEFVMINNKLSVLLVLKKENILTSPMVEVPNKYISKGEFFFQVPIQHARFYHI